MNNISKPIQAFVSAYKKTISTTMKIWDYNRFEHNLISLNHWHRRAYLTLQSTYLYAHARTRTRTRTYTNIQAYKHTHTLTCIDKQKWSLITYVYARTKEGTVKLKGKHKHANIRARTHIHTHICEATEWHVGRRVGGNVPFLLTGE